MPANVKITTEEKILITLTPTSASGNPAEVENVEWIVEGEGSDVTVEPQEDGKSAYIISGSTIGNFVVRVRADADLSEGVSHIEDTINTEIAGPQAASLGFMIGAPEPK